MKLLNISLKNITGNIWRSMTMTIFLFLTSLMLVVSNALLLTVKENMQAAIRGSLSGELQIRPIETEETDLFPMGSSWDKLVYLSSEEIMAIEEILEYQIKPKAYTPCIRATGKLVSEDDETSSMAMGIDLKVTEYQKTLVLQEGRYADKGYEVVISTEEAERLEVGVGDWVEFMLMDKDDTYKSKSFKVVGIGNVQILSNFGLSPIYIDIDTMRELSGFHQKEATDVFVYCALDEVTSLKGLLQETWQKASVTQEAFKVTTWKEMGGFVNAILLMQVGMLYIFIGVFMVIVGVLILNIITIVISERRIEIGSLRAIGFSRRQVVRIFMGEMLAIAVGSSLLGCFVGCMINRYLSQQTITVYPPLDYMLGSFFTLTYKPLQWIPVLILVVIFTGVTSLRPCVRAVKERPVEILRG